MKLAIAIFRYFPYGGLQRDMRFIAEEAIKRGHQVTIFCGDWQGEKIPDADVRVIDTFVWFNIAGVRRFVKAFEKEFDRKQFDLLLGFNKMPGLDVYFAGDTCFAEKAYRKRSWLYRLAPRTRMYLNYEKNVFGQLSKACILSLVDSQKFVEHYATPSNRFFFLPPGIIPAHVTCVDPEMARSNLLNQLSLKSRTKIIVCLGSDFRRKGVDISIDVFSYVQNIFPNSVLLVVGQDDAKAYQQQAKNLGVVDKVFFMGACDQVGELLHAADVLLHLAREELAGNVILEAMLCNCPVLVSAVCGYADYVSQYGMGSVVDSLDDTPAIAKELTAILQQEKSLWMEKSRQFYLSGVAFSRIPVMMDILEKIKSGSHNKIQQITIEDWRNLQINSDNAAVFEFMFTINGNVVRKMRDRETLCIKSDSKIYYLKRHFGVGWREIIKNLCQFRLPVVGAGNEWQALKKLADAGVPSLQAVTYGSRGRNPAQQESFIVTDELDKVIQLDHFLASSSGIDIKQRIALIKKVAGIARGMHLAGINHRDFYLCHFMLKQEWINNQPDIYIIDLHRAQVRTMVPRRWLVKDLSALYFSSMSLPISPKDRLRFLRCYFQTTLHEIYERHSGVIHQVEKRAVQLFSKHNK